MPTTEPNTAASATAPTTNAQLPALAGSAVSVRLNYVSFADGEVRVIGDSVLGQWVTRSGWGAYGSLATAALETDEESEYAIGGLELGGLYAAEGSSGASSVVRFGVVLPTGPSLENTDEVATAALAGVSYLPDFAQLAPSSTWVRLTYSPTIRQGAWVASADLGLDLPVINPKSGSREIDLDVLVRANVALGGVSGRSQFLLELNTLYNPQTNGDQAIHTIGASYRYLGSWEPFFSVQRHVGLPGDDFVKIGIGVSLGIAKRL